MNIDQELRDEEVRTALAMVRMMRKCLVGSKTVSDKTILVFLESLGSTKKSLSSEPRVVAQIEQLERDLHVALEEKHGTARTESGAAHP